MVPVFKQDQYNIIIFGKKNEKKTHLSFFVERRPAKIHMRLRNAQTGVKTAIRFPPVRNVTFAAGRYSDKRKENEEEE